VGLNALIRGKRITKRLSIAGGYPKFSIVPKVVRWGTNVSVFWLGTELVWLGRETKT
jgi:hypothetical protein